MNWDQITLTREQLPNHKIIHDKVFSYFLEAQKDNKIVEHDKFIPTMIIKNYTPILTMVNSWISNHTQIQQGEIFNEANNTRYECIQTSIDRGQGLFGCIYVRPIKGEVYVFAPISHLAYNSFDAADFLAKTHNFYQVSDIQSGRQDVEIYRQHFGFHNFFDTFSYVEPSSYLYYSS